VIVAAVLVYWLANAARTLPAAGANAYTDFGVPLSAEVISDLEAQAVDAPVAADGTQTIGLAVNGNNMSYSPNVIKVKKGQPVTLNITHNDGGPDCNLYVGIEKLGVHVYADPGETTPMTFTPDRAGIFQLNCGMHMMNPGYIIVTQ
jgi:plastocyanin domain-containing protein